MSPWEEFKAGWREAGEKQRRVFPWALLATIILMLLDWACGWHYFAH